MLANPKIGDRVRFTPTSADLGPRYEPYRGELGTIVKIDENTHYGISVQFDRDFRNAEGRNYFYNPTETYGWSLSPNDIEEATPTTTNSW